MRRPTFVRPISDAEREVLEEGGLRSSDAFILRRCQILLQSSRGGNAYRVARSSLGCDPQAARTATKRFDEGTSKRGSHGKRRVVEADRLLLGAHELAERVCEALDARTTSTCPFPKRSPDHALDRDGIHDGAAVVEERHLIPGPE